jgi:hypothetical protein
MQFSIGRCDETHLSPLGTLGFKLEIAAVQHDSRKHAEVKTDAE